MKPQWRPVIGYEGWYEVSNMGSVRRIRRGKSTHPGYVLKLYQKKNRRLSVTFSKDGIQNKKEVAHVVAEAFLGPRPQGLEINHIDGNPANNNPQNLEYVTRQQNMQHACRLGLIKVPTGEAHHLAKLSVEKIIVIRGAWAQGVAIRMLARVFGVKHSTIKNVVYRNTWANI